MGQSLGDLAVGGRKDTAEGRARNAHPLRGLFLVQPFQIGQPDRFELVEREDDLDQTLDRNPLRDGTRTRSVSRRSGGNIVVWT